MAAATIPRIAGYRFDVAANLADPATRRRLSPAGIKAFLRIAQRWGIKDQDACKLLGGMSSGSGDSRERYPGLRLAFCCRQRR